MLYTLAIITAICAYLVGSINPSIILSKSIYGRDIRESGSGNAGATNMLRTHGAGMAIATLLCDILKGTLVVVLAKWLDNMFIIPPEGATAYEQFYIFGNLKYIAAIAVVIGHDFPIYFGFHGGKGVATSLGVVLALDPLCALFMLFGAVLIMAVSRYVSLGSITAAALYPFIVFVTLLANNQNPSENVAYILMAFILAIILILKHHSNIRKLLAGTENKLFAKKVTEENDIGTEEDEE